jgi:hypothetical protein
LVAYKPNETPPPPLNTHSVDRARKILLRSRLEARGEWKVFLESVLLEMRAGQWDRAVEEAKAALQIHTGTGRLWAILVQLRYLDGDAEQLRVLRQALGEVPKSGEVWCEGARIHLSPLSRAFDLRKAEQYLDFAIQFTPQYGDSFLELLRLLLLREVVLPQAHALHARILEDQGDKGEEGEAAIRRIARAAEAAAAPGSPGRPTVAAFMACETEELELRCSNADPNYGQLWFHVRDMPSDTPRLLMRRAKALMAEDLTVLYPLYLTAIVRRLGVERRVRAAAGLPLLLPKGKGEEEQEQEQEQQPQPLGEEQRLAAGASTQQGNEESSSSSSSSSPNTSAAAAEERKEKKEEKGKDAEMGAASSEALPGTDGPSPSTMAAATATTATAAKIETSSSSSSPSSSSSDKGPTAPSAGGGDMAAVGEQRDDKVELKEPKLAKQQLLLQQAETEAEKARRKEEQRALLRVERGVDAALAREAPVEPCVVDGEGKLLRLEQWDFVTGLVGLNRIASRVATLRDEEKRKMLFGSDQLVP